MRLGGLFLRDGPGPTVLLDTNVFVAAVKHPSRSTVTYRLLVRLLARPDVRLVGNDLLAAEYLRYAETFPSPTAAAVAAALLAKMDIVRVEDRHVRACAPYLPAGEAADRVHAATCLQTGAILISNDPDFDAIARAGLVERRTVTEALRWLLAEQP